MLRVGADIGGTFTDIVFLGPDGTVRAAKLLSTPDDYGRAILDGLRRPCARRGCGDRGDRPWDHGRDQCDPRAERRQGRADHDQRLPGCARDPARAAAGAVRHHVAQARAAGPTRAPARGRRARRPGRRGATAARSGGRPRRDRAAEGARLRVGGGLLPPQLRQCRARARGGRAPRRRVPVRLAVVPGPARAEGVRAYRHDRRRRIREAGGEPLPGQSAHQPGCRGRGGAGPRDAVGRRHLLRPRGGGKPGADHRERSGGRGDRRGGGRARRRARQLDHVRHGRYHREGVDHRARRDCPVGRSTRWAGASTRAAGSSRAAAT